MSNLFDRLSRCGNDSADGPEELPDPVAVALLGAAFPPVEPSEALRERVQARLAAASKQAPVRRTRPVWMAWTLAGALGAAAIPAVVAILGPRMPGRQPRRHNTGQVSQPSTRQQPLPRQVREAPRTPAPRGGLVAPPRARTAYAVPVAPQITPRPTVPQMPLPDDRYLDGRDGALLAGWVNGDADANDLKAWASRIRVPMRDDFVRPMLPRLAGGGSHGVADAAKQAEKEAQIVDTRLFRKVTLALKGASLEECCAELERLTGVRIQTTRGVADEKVTVLVDNRPAREVMREVARLFGYFWSRVGEEGAYKYALEQDLRSQLAEEEMRSRDQNAALLELDAQIRASAPDLDRPAAELSARMERATGPEKERLRNMLRGGWGIAQVYRHLSPAELTALRNGTELEFSEDDPDPNRRLPAEWRDKLVLTSRDRFMNPDGGQVVTPADLPDAKATVSIKINRSELGQLTLEGYTNFASPSANFTGGIRRTLAVGKSPSTARPDNASANKPLRELPAFQPRVTLHPEAKCPGLTKWEHPATVFNSGQPLLGEGRQFAPHLHSDEVWEELHRRTGLPIVADYYTHLYEAAPLQVEDTKLFDALCRTGDALGVRWRPDGDFVLARSTGFFWDKLKEVPGRLIRRWQADARTKDGLPLQDLLEMASLSDQQLDSRPVGEAMRRCLGLDEWLVVGGPKNEIRPWARFLSQLPPPLLSAALSPDGLALDTLPQGLQAEWLRAYHSPPNPGMRLRAEYVPAGRYVWMPTVPEGQSARLVALPILSARTVQEGLAAARRYLPGTVPSDFRRSAGVLSIKVYTPGEEATAYWKGRPPVLVDPAGVH